MIAPPAFASVQEYSARLGDVVFWRPYRADILRRRGLIDPAREPTAGVGGSYPTFLCGDVVVKLFGYVPFWRASHAAERAAQRLVATDPEIAAPALRSEGRLFDALDAPWPYL